MKCISAMLQTGISGDGIALNNGLHMTAANLDAHTGTAWTKRRRADASHILGQRQRSTATQEAKRLPITFIHFHTSHTSIVLGCGDKLHSEGCTQIGLRIDNIVDFFYVHCLRLLTNNAYLYNEYSFTSQASALAPSTSRSPSFSIETRIRT